MGTPDDLILGNARLVLADRVVDAGVVARQGEIVEITDNSTTSPGAVDLEGDFLVPGLVKMHTDNLERHIRPRPNVYWPIIPALMAHDAQIAAAGITTVFDAIVVSGSSSGDHREKIMASSAGAIAECRDAGLLRAEPFLHLRCEVANPNSLELFEP